MTNTFSGIDRNDVPHFVVAQVVGAVIASLFFSWLAKGELKQRSAADTVAELPAVARKPRTRSTG